MKIGYFVNRIGPYHDARFREVSDCDIIAIEMFAKDATYSWDQTKDRPYANTTLFDNELSSPNIQQYQRAIISVVNKYKLDVLAIPGWSSAWAIVATEIGVREDIPIILLSDTFQLRSNSLLELFVKRSLVSVFSSALTAGSPHQRFLHSLGMKPTQTFDGYDVVDNSFFKYNNSNPLINGPYILCVARFVWEKKLSFLLQEYARSNSRKTHKLVLAGDGPERFKLQSLADKLGISASVCFVGFVSYPEVRTLYRHADLFILPSKSETWGLSVNEAMASSLPVLVSNACGCAEDLVKSGLNGQIIYPDKEGSISEGLDNILCSQNRGEMGQKSLEIIDKWGLSRFRENLLNAGIAAITHHKSSLKKRLLKRVILRAALNKF